MRFSLKNKMASTVCLLLLVTLSLAAILSLRFYSQELKATIARQQFSLVSEIARNIDLQISTGQEIITRTAAGIAPEIAADPERIQLFLDQRLGEASKLFFDNGIFFFSPAGILLAEYPFKPDRRGKDYAFRDYFQQTVSSDRPQVSAPYISSQTHHHPAINFTAPVFDGSGTLSGVIAGSVDLTKDNFLGGLNNVTIGSSGYLYLFNRDRLMIMHPDPTRIMQKDVPPGANLLFDRAIAGFEGTEETINSRGIRMLTSFKPLATTDWILAANYPAREAFAPIASSHRYSAIGLLILLAGSTLVVWLVMWHLTRPLLSFTRHVQTLTTKDAPRQPLPITSEDEIGVLVQSFNQLMAEVEEQRRLSASRLRFLQTLSDSIPNPIYYKDPAGRYLGCNRAYEEIRGLSRAELLGKKTSEISAGAEGKEQERAEAALLLNPETTFEIFEKPVTYRDGNRHDVLFYKAVFRDETGRPAGLVGTMVDISQRKAMETALAAQQQFSEKLLQNSAVPCYVLDTNHRVLIWNRACEELTGLPAVEMVGSDRHWNAFYPEQRPCLADLVLDNDIEKILDLYQTFSDSQLIPEGLQAEGWYPDVGGKRRYLFFEAAPIRDSLGKCIAVIETLQDHSSLKHAEEALQKSEESYRALIERSPDAIVVHRRGRAIFVNQAAASLFGAAGPEQMSGLAIMDLVHPDHRQTFQERSEQPETGQLYVDGKILRLDGGELDVEVCSTPVFYRDDWSVQMILRDISERKALQEQIWRQANFDGLTRIPNRMLFNDRLQQAIERAVRENHMLALMFIDLDHFKEINDTLGHEAGDSLLKQVAARLKKGVRKSDTLARMGGDEFTVLLTGVTEPLHVNLVAGQLLAALARPFELPGGEGRISGSIGIALYPRDGTDIATLLHHADSAMYRAKQSGRNGICFYSSAEPC